MGRTYVLSSPHMSGTDVQAMQRVLHRSGYYEGPLDGDYGPLTAQAAYRAKYWLGYPKPDHAAGDKLYGFLTGANKLPTAYKLIAAGRLKLRVNDRGFKALKEAVRWLGTKESPPNTNRVFFTAFWNVVCPWCAIFVSYCGIQAGSRIFKKATVHYTYVPKIVSDARNAENGLTVTVNPKSGDIPCYDWDNDNVADHTGLYAEEEHLRQLCPDELAYTIKHVGGLHTGEFWAVEGNTSFGNNSNGGEVMIRKRTKGDVVLFAHMGK